MDPLVKAALLRTFVFLSLVSLSPLLFVHVEYTDEDNKEEKFQLLLSLYESMASNYNMTLTEFNNFSNVAHEALSEPKPRWTYFNAMNFVLQAFSTIGYGWITPQTPTGQVLCIFVSVVGIPITLLALKSVGELITKLVNTVVTKFEKKVLKRGEPKRVQTKSAGVLVALMVLLMIANSFFTRYIADWTIVEGVYFWFVSFTTIGFGDYNVQQPQRIKQLSFDSSGNLANKDVDGNEFIFEFFEKKILTLYYLVNLCIVASVLNSIMAAIEERKWCPRCPGCVPRKTHDHADNNSTEQHELDITSLNVENTGLQTRNMGSLAVSKMKFEKDTFARLPSEYGITTHALSHSLDQYTQTYTTRTSTHHAN
ncbi:hypothetical protein ACROYT_G006350 [Oculina patagonica]